MASPHLYTFGSFTYDLDSRTYLMGILNVTPDSFSDGGLHLRVEDAVERGLQMVEQGADFIDIGGESTRPGAKSVPLDEELQRVIPVIERLAKETKTPISIDTYKPDVAEEALKAGAVIVNDITGLHGDSRMAEIIARKNATVILMHMQGTPGTMQEHPHYDNVIKEICSYLSEAIQLANERGIQQIILDPGVGFGKTLEHNLEIFRELNKIRLLGYPLLVGPSRKSFIGKILGLPIDKRLEGTLASVSIAIMNGANIVRVHDVKEVKMVAQVIDAVNKQNS